MLSPRLFLAASIVGIAIVGAGSRAEQTAPEPTPAFDVVVSVIPDRFKQVQLLARPTLKTYSCAASVSEPGTDRHLSPPSLVVAPGKPEHSTREVDGFTVRFSAFVSDTAGRVETELTVSMGSRPLSWHHDVP